MSICFLIEVKYLFLLLRSTCFTLKIPYRLPGTFLLALGTLRFIRVPLVKEYDYAATGRESGFSLSPVGHINIPDSCSFFANSRFLIA